jgi:hypothetical protein
MSRPLSELSGEVVHEQIMFGGQIVQASIQSRASALSSENEASMMKKLQAFSDKNLNEDIEITHLVPTEYVFGLGIKSRTKMNVQMRNSPL